MATAETRQRPNILVTGTPGTGKSTMCELLGKELGFECINCSAIVVENKLYCEYDEEFHCHVLDEEKLLDHIEEELDSEQGGHIVEYHGADFFPKRWFDFVIVLRCNNTKLYDRLAARGYSAKKIEKNIECEIFGTLLEEVKESYDEDIIYELQNETYEQMCENIERICKLVALWKKS